MKKQGIIEMVVGILGIAILLISQKQEWSYIPLVLYGILSVVMIRRMDELTTDEEKNCRRKRNITSLISLPIFAIICYFAANDAIKDNFLWILLSVYLFLTAHGIMFIAPINAFGNERK